MKKLYSTLLGLLVGLASASAATYYITPEGSASNDGSSYSKAKALVTAMGKAAAGDSLILQPGTYTITYKAAAKNTIACAAVGTAGKRITVCCPDGMATLDFSFPELTYVQNSYGLSVTGSYWYFKNLVITHAGYQGAYVTGGYNTFEHCVFFDNRNSGLEINKGGNHTTVVNCDAYRNYDPKKGGSMADGFAPKQTQGAGNNFHGCRSWNNGDDGYDCFDSPEAVTFDSCWAFCNGIDIWHYSGDGVVAFAGNGNGFKLGGNAAQANNVATRCVAFGNPTKGFDQNNNTGGITLYNCVAYANGTYDYALGGTLNSGQQHIIKNCVSIGGKADFGSADEDHNSWDKNFSASKSDFQSVDTSLARTARNVDGSLADTKLFRLKTTSKLVNAGTDVGLDYAESAPELGAFELIPDAAPSTGVDAVVAVAPVSFYDRQLRLSVPSEVTISKASGVVVYQNKAASVVDCSGWAAGIYIVVVNGSASYKMVVR
jgi:hypothetical protein